nr:cytochrome P450 87A3-like [Tanacetum cinerariifolium]
MKGWASKEIVEIKTAVADGWAYNKKTFPDIENVATKNMKGRASKEIVEIKTAVADMIFELMGKKLISYDRDKSFENLREYFGAFIQGSRNC